MSYLNPPPGDAPVVVMKDVGGYVDQYGAQTALYYQTNREVRLHECRSACTLALSLPNVCVYPDSILKFHQAYNPITRGTNLGVSQAMMAAYPAAVRERLGQLSRQYKVLTGSELIRLGIRDCNSPPQPRIMIARARMKENPPENPVSNAFSGIVATLAPQAPPVSGAPVKIQRVKVQIAEAKAPEVRGPEGKVAEVKVADAAPPPVAAQPQPAPEKAKTDAPRADAPLLPVGPESPPRPPELASAAVPAPLTDAPQPAPRPQPATGPQADVLAQSAPAALFSNWGRPIKGSAPILVGARFAPFPYRVAGRS